MADIPVQGVALRQLFAHQALIGWQDKQSGLYQHLGRLSTADSSSAKLMFCIDSSTDHILIHFHLPVKARPSNPKSIKHMHLIIPVEDLHLAVDLVAVRDTPIHTRRQLERDGMSLDSLVVHTSFEVGRPAYTVMPLGSRPVQTRLVGPPGQLLRHLRSLTESQALDVFLSFGTVSSQLEAVRNDLRQGIMKTPLVDLDAMYARGIRGSINAWAHYVCDEAELPTAAWNPFIDVDPPPYDDVVSQGQMDGEPNDIHQAISHISDDNEKLEWRVGPPSRSPVVFQDYGPSEGITRGQKRKAVSPASQSKRDGSTTEEDPFLLHTGPMAPTYQSQPVVIDAIHATSEAIKLLHGRGHASNWSLLNKPQLLLELQEWLIQAWKQDPQAHQTYIAEFKVLGKCARDDDVPGFNAAMSVCQAKTLEAVYSGTPSSSSMSSDLLEQVNHIRSWMNETVCRNAGTIMAGNFTQLGISARDTMNAGCNDEVMRIFNAKKAACIAAAFYTFSGRW